MRVGDRLLSVMQMRGGGQARAGAAASAARLRAGQWSARRRRHFRELFETDCAVFIASNGTAANALAMAVLCQS